MSLDCRLQNSPTCTRHKIYNNPLAIVRLNILNILIIFLIVLLIVLLLHLQVLLMAEATHRVKI